MRGIGKFTGVHGPWKGFTKPVLSVTVGALVAVSIGGGVAYFAVISPQTPSEAPHAFQMNCSEVAQLLMTGSGWSRYGFEHTQNFSVEQTNLTWVTFRFRWDDEAGSPLTDPDVLLTFEAPNGTIIFNGPPVKGQEYEWKTSFNDLPTSASVRAPSSSEALSRAMAGINETMGTGLWNWTLDVGPMPFARNQIRSGVFTDYSFEVGFVEAVVTQSTP